MRLGLLTAPFPETPLADVVDWTAANGFESIEIACWPRADRRRPGATPARATSTSRTCRRARRSEIVGEIAANGPDDLRPRLLPEPAPPRPRPPRRGHRPPEARHHRRREDGRPARQHVHGRRRREGPGRELGGGAPGLAGHRRVRPATTAASSPSRTARCCSADDEWPGGHNLATTPRIWRRILEQWGGTVGLNFDPSHLILQMIDIPRFIREFGPHILHVQAKDLMIDRDGLYERGIFSMGIGWQVPRLPGPRRRRLGASVRRAVARRLRRRRDHRARGPRLREDRRARQARVPARPRRPPPVHQVRPMTLSIDALTYRDVAKTIDHSLLRPELDDAFVEAGCRLAAGLRRRLGLRPAGRRRPGARRSSTARTSRSGRPSASRTATTGPRPRSSRRAGRSPTARRELDMVLQIGALKSGPRRRRPGGHRGRSSRSPMPPAPSSRSSSRTPT